MTNKLEDVVVDSYRVLLDYALSHGGDTASTRIPALEAERDQALRRAERLEGVQADLEKTRRILQEERGQHDKTVADLGTQILGLEQERDAATKRVEQLAQSLADMDAQLGQAQQRFTNMQAELDKANANNPLGDTERADLVRLVGQAVEFFEEDPDRAHKALTRTLLTLNGDTNND